MTRTASKRVSASTPARSVPASASYPTILATLDDPDLFAPHFKGETWAAWRAFSAALFGLPMEDEALALYRHHTGRTEPPTAPFKEAARLPVSTPILGCRGVRRSRLLRPWSEAVLSHTAPVHKRIP